MWQDEMQLTGMLLTCDSSKEYKLNMDKSSSEWLRHTPVLIFNSILFYPLYFEQSIEDKVHVLTEQSVINQVANRLYFIINNGYHGNMPTISKSGGVKV